MKASILRPLANNDERWFVVFDLRVFDQGTWWLTRERAPARISAQSELGDTELVTVVRDLHDRRVGLQNAYCSAFPARTVLSNPSNWMESTELMIALKAEACLRGLDVANRADEAAEPPVSGQQMTTPFGIAGGKCQVPPRPGGRSDLDQGNS